MLLRNFDVASGLCNGFLFIVRHIGQRVLICEHDIISQTYRQFCAPVFRPCLSYAWVAAVYFDVHPGPSLYTIRLSVQRRSGHSLPGRGLFLTGFCKVLLDEEHEHQDNDNADSMEHFDGVEADRNRMCSFDNTLSKNFNNCAKLKTILT
ncbi:unnamed protein product [Heligmosomoides polygyrus]|uniref:Secreted protein n=1 Tax=Heligmosomoides polygyrus TaxID=6339 RepID=A0A3P8CQS5_HELPZ|nr:unnamed protein product [Heligmosomoides polygyrus]